MTSLQSQLERTQLDLAEVIDEVVFAENAKKRAEDDLDQYRLQALRGEGVLVRCIESLTQYVCVLEQDIVVPAIGSFVVSLADHHDVTRLRSGAVQATENIVASHNAVGAAGDRILANLQPPTANTATAARRQKALQQGRQGLRHGASIEDAFVLATSLLAEGSRVQAAAVACGQLIEDYQEYSSARARSVEANRSGSALATAEKQQTIALLREEVDFLRKTVSEQQSRLHGPQSPGGSQPTAEVAALRRELEEERHHSARRFQASSERMESLLRTIRDLEADLAARHSHSPPSPSAAAAGSPAETRALRGRIAQLEDELKRRDASQERLADKITAAERLSSGGTALSAADAAQTAHVIHLLQDEIKDLRAELENQRRTAEHAKGKLAKKNEKLARQVQSLSTAEISLDVSKQHELMAQQSEYHAKLKAFEMTVHALNSELASLEDRMHENDRRHVDDVSELKAELSAERKDRANERQEYEMVINRLTTEIENLMKENVELKQRLRQSFESH